MCREKRAAAKAQGRRHNSDSEDISDPEVSDGDAQRDDPFFQHDDDPFNDPFFQVTVGMGSCRGCQWLCCDTLL